MWSLLLILLTLLSPQVQQGAYTPLELTFRVYDDGYVAVDYLVSLDPTRVEINITLFGLLYQDLIIEDQEGLPLNYSQFEGGITLESLGSTSAHITYVTPDLTNKSGRLWLFSVEASIPSTILLPEGADVTDLSDVPLSLSTVDDAPLLIMPAGLVEVYYALGIVGTREHALALIKEAEAKIEEAKAEGLVVEEAEGLLEEASKALGEERYTQAEELASKALEEAEKTMEEAHRAMEAIKEAEGAIEEARGEGRTSGLEKAEALLQQASEAYQAGSYGEAEALALQAEEAAEAAEKPINPYLYIAVGGVVTAVAMMLLLRRRRGGGEIAVEGLLERHPDLRFEDREVVRFLAESGGEAFAAEIRERFKMPRTSVWRLIRRLEREGLVEVKLVGGHSLVRLRR
ncbi:MAG: hypothetical protein AYL28_006570 [Candidatus Bathyarchaeota archaeon B23]|nr:MAG: hypothetical protein AYL28_006570 [Candidatus Bathyarchaeota archaeon B23]